MEITEFEICICFEGGYTFKDYEHMLHGFMCENIPINGYMKDTKPFIYSNLKESRLRSKKQAVCGKSTLYHTSFQSDGVFYIRTADPIIIDLVKKNIKKGMIVIPHAYVSSVKSKTITPSTIGESKYLKSYPSSPILIQTNFDKVENVWEPKYQDIEEYLKNNVESRAKRIGVPIGDFTIDILEMTSSKPIRVKSLAKDPEGTSYIIGRNMTIKVNGDQTVKEFIMLHGIGRSLGLGFGFMTLI